MKSPKNPLAGLKNWTAIVIPRAHSDAQIFFFENNSDELCGMLEELECQNTYHFVANEFYACQPGTLKEAKA